MSHSRGILLFALLATFACAVGCASAPALPKAEWFSFSKKKPPDDEGIVTPRAKMEQLRELAKRADKMSPELQQQISNELAQGIAHEQDPVLRAQILRTLGYYPTEKAENILAAGLRDNNRDVRIAACDGLGQRKGPNAATELARALAEDADLDVRLAAARALGETADAKAVAPLGEALDDQDPAMQHRAVASLKKVSGEDYGNDLEAWRQYAKTGQGPEQPSLVQRFFKLF